MELIIIALGLIACAYLIYQRIEKSRDAHWREYLEKVARAETSRMAESERHTAERTRVVVQVSLPEGSATSAEQLAASTTRQMNRAMRRNT